MSDDTKVDFYLANRALIEEWAALRGSAANALEVALLAAANRIGDDDGLPAPEIKEGGTVLLRATTDPLPSVRFELWWQRHSLLKGTSGWPYLAISMSSKHPKSLRASVRDAVIGAKQVYGLTSTSGQTWLRSGQVVPDSEPIDIEAYAEFCVQRLRELWAEFHEVVTKVVETHGVE